MYSKSVLFYALISLIFFALVRAQESNQTIVNPPGASTLEAIVANTTTTDPKTTTTTTPSPVTTVPVSTTTSGPTPKPDQFSGNVTEGDITCINVKFSVQIGVKYNTTKNVEKEVLFNVPVNASVIADRSHCNSTTSKGLEVITIGFANHPSANLTITFNNTNGNVFAQEVQLSFDVTKEVFPDFNVTYGQVTASSKSDLKLFNVPTVHSYYCAKAQLATLTAKGFNDIGVFFTESKVEAFIEDKKKGEFDTEIDCKSAEISDVVPIAVGAALAGLVVIVLIAYFIGRRRSRRLAYQSV